MTNDIKRLERKIEELEGRIERVERRVIWNAEPGADARLEPENVAREPSPLPEGIPGTVIMSLIGRSLIVLGGAFLLRWLTQSGVLPPKIGSIAGMFYALLWVVMADVSAGRGRRYSAAFHGVTSALIALPLLVEVTITLDYLTPTLSAIHLFAFIIIGIAVAWRRRLRVLAWIVTVPAAPLAFFLAVQTSATTPFLTSLLFLGVATLWLGYLRHWHALATVMAGAVNLGLALMVMEYTVVSNRVDSAPETALWEVLFLLFGNIALYFGSYCFRVFKRKRTITPIEIGNTLVVLLVGVGGAAMVIDATTHSMGPLGVACLVVAAASYIAAYGFLPRKDPNRRNFVFYTLLALIMVLLSVEMLLPHPAAAVALAAFALIAGTMAARVSSPILYLHGAAYLLAAVIQSGLLVAIKAGLVESSASLTVWFHFPVLLTFALALIYPWFPKPQGRPRDMYLGRRATDIFLFVSVLALCGLFVSLVTRVGPHGEGSDIYAGLLASARTGALAASAAFLAWYSRKSGTARFGNLRWLVYTILALGAVKLAYEDIASGGAAALFVSLGLYGGALILAPRLLHGGMKPETPDP